MQVIQRHTPQACVHTSVFLWGLCLIDHCSSRATPRNLVRRTDRILTGRDSDPESQTSQAIRGREREAIEFESRENISDRVK